MGNQISLIIMMYNQRELLEICLEWLGVVKGVNRIILIDNGLNDGTSELLSTTGYEYIFFDEGRQGYGTLWNAAIDNFQLDDVIIFMDIRYVAGRNTFEKLAETVKKEEKIGIVGPRSNGIVGRQYMMIDSMEHMLELEEANANSNITCSYAEVVGIDAGIWAISQKRLKETGRFNENLIDAQNVLMDYEFKMIQKGLCAVVCNEALVFDIQMGVQKEGLKESDILNDRRFMKKIWNMNYFNIIPNGNLSALVNESHEAEFSVLEVGCDLGANLLDIKSRYPNCKIHGVEINPSAVNIAKYLLDVREGNIEEENLSFEEKFDYIIFGDVLEHLHNPQKTIRYCNEKLLKEHGCIVASIPNIMHISVMEQLLHGRFTYQDTGLLDKTHIHFFTYYEILSMFQEENYSIEEVYISTRKLTEEQEELKVKLMEISHNVEMHMYDTFQYVVKARC